MAYRVRNTNVISFGTITASSGATVSHVRFRVGSDDSDPVVVALGSNVTVNQNGALQIPANGMAVKYVSGALTDSHMENVVKDYWENVSFEIDAMSDSNTVITAAGYSQASNSAWSFDKPAD